MQRPLNKQDILQSAYLFRNFSPEVVGRVALLASTRRCAAGEVLFMRGDEGDALYGVLSGRIRISNSSIAGKEVVLSIMQPGDVFGEMALLDGGDRTADAEAIGATELMVLRRADFLRLMKEDSNLAVQILKLVCLRLRQTNQRVEDSAFLDLPARLAKRLIQLDEDYATEDEPHAFVAISQAELGAFLGASRESINKHLQVWRQEGWIELARGKVRVIDPASLVEVVEFGAMD